MLINQSLEAASTPWVTAASYLFAASSKLITFQMASRYCLDILVFVKVMKKEEGVQIEKQPVTDFASPL